MPGERSRTQSGRQRHELAHVDQRLLRLVPWIRLAVEREQHAFIQRLAVGLVLQHHLLRMIEADPLQIMDGTLQIPAFLAVQLQEGARIFQHFLVGLDLDEELRDFGLDAAVAADVNFPAGIDADHADVLDAGFGAVARATGNRDLDLVRRVHAAQLAFQLLPHQRRILGAIRMLTAAIKQKEVDERIDVTDAQVLAIIEKMIKQRKDSISQFEAGGRQDLADIEKVELAILSVYMPAALSDAEVRAAVTDAIAETGAAGPQDMGKLMAVLKPKLAGRADMTAVSALVKAALSKA